MTRKVLALILLVFAFLTCRIYAQLPTLSYSSPKTYVANTAMVPLTPTGSGVGAPGYAATSTIPYTGFSQPTGVAVDLLGNIYVADNDNEEVYKIPAAGGALVVLGSGFVEPTGVAVDAAGDVFVADNGANAVYEIVAGSNSPSSIGTGFSHPFSVAVDLTGNVYVADGSNNAVKKIVAGNGTTVTIGTGFDTPQGVAVDAAGNVYVADFGNNAIKKILVGGGPVQTLGSGFDSPMGVAVDNTGNVYVADSENSAIKTIPALGGATTILGPQFSTPTGVAVDITGNVFVADVDQPSIFKVARAGGYYISPALPLGLSLNQTTGVISGTPLLSNPATIYTITACNASGSALKKVSITITLPALPAVSYTSPAAFTAGVAIAPVTPTSANVAAANYSLIATNVGSGFTTLSDVAVDPLGNVFAMDNAIGAGQQYTLKEIPFGVGSAVNVVYSPTDPYANGYYYSIGLGTDLSGNIYADGVYNLQTTTNNLTQEIRRGVITPFIGPFSGPTSHFVVDAAANIYYTIGTGVAEIFADNGTTAYLLQNIAPVYALCIDGANNLYLSSGSKILKIPVASSSPVTLTTAIPNPGNITVDAAGNLYVVDGYDNAVYKVPANGGVATTIGTGLTNPQGLALDHEGNVFIASSSFSSVKKLKPAGGYYIYPFLPAGLSFDSNTGIISGTPLATMQPVTYTVTAYNCSGKTSATVTLSTNNAPAVAVPAISYTGPDTYAAGTSITPLAPLSTGVALAGYSNVNVSLNQFNNLTLTAFDINGNIYTTTTNGSIYKTSPKGGIPILVGTNFTAAGALTVDPKGNIFVSSYYTTYYGNTSELYEIPANGGTYKYIASGDNNNFAYDIITGCAVDVAGDIFYSKSSTTGGLIEIPAGGGTAVTLGGQIAGGNFIPIGIGLDGAGNLYVNYNTPTSVNSTIVMLPAGGGSPVGVSTFPHVVNMAVSSAGDVYVSDNTAKNVTKVTGPTGSNGIIGPGLSGALSIDQTGNIYITANNTLTKITAGGSTPVALTHGFTASAGKAVMDAAGNLYAIVGTTIQELPAVGGGPVPYASGFSAPQSLAIDGLGNIYVTDATFVYRVSPLNGTQTTIASGLTAPTKVTVDGSGNVYVIDNGKILKLPPARGVPLSIGPVFQSPDGLIADPTGNVYVADASAGTIIKIPADGSAAVNLGPGFTTPGDIGIDASGNVFVIDAGTNSVKEIPVGGGSPIVVGAAFEHPGNVCVGGNGVLYVTDGGNLKTISPTGGFYGNPLLPAGLTINANTGTISGIPKTTVAATNYTVTGYNNGGNFSCAVNIAINGLQPSIKYINRSVYSLNTAIPTLAPTSYNVGAASYGNTQTSVGTANGTLVALASDSSGVVYTAYNNNNGIYKTLLTGVTSFFSSNNSPATTYPSSGVAIDRSGTVYIVNTNYSSYATANGTYGYSFYFNDNTAGPAKVTVDPLGNVYALGYNTTTLGNSVVKLGQNANSGSTVLADAFNGPTGIAADITGAVYVADNVDKTVYKVISLSTAPVSIGSGYAGPSGVATDASGNLFIADITTIKEIPAGGSLITIASGFTNAVAVACDAAGNIYVADAGVSKVLELSPTGGYFISRALPAGLSFNPATGAITGTPTAITTAANYTVTGYNANGSSVSSFTIAVTPNADLASLTLSNGTLSPTFAPATVTYTAGVGNGLKTMTITPTVADPAATVTVNGVSVTSGTASGALPLVVGNNAIPIVVTGSDGITKKTYMLTVNEARSSNANLSGLVVSTGALSPVFNANALTYTQSVTYPVSAIALTPTTADATATVTVNGTKVNSGSAAAVSLNVGTNTIAVVVTAQNQTTKTYTITVTRAAPSTNDNLSALTITKGTLTPAFAASTINYADMVTNGTASLTVTPTAQVATSTTSVNGVTVSSGVASAAITLAIGTNTISVNVTAQDGITTKNYSIVVTRPSTNAKLTNFTISSGSYTPVFNPATLSYSASVTNAVASITLIPTVAVTGSTVKVKGVAVVSGNASGAIPLATGTNTVTMVVTAQDGATTTTYTLTVTRAATGLTKPNDAISVIEPAETTQLENDGIFVHQGISPNGDGINDFLQIDNISQYPDNNLKVTDRNGLLIYEAKGYDNATKIFDGHSNKNGRMQLPGTYFYSLNYTINGVVKHKTGFLVLKY